MDTHLAALAFSQLLKSAASTRTNAPPCSKSEPICTIIVRHFSRHEKTFLLFVVLYTLFTRYKQFTEKLRGILRGIQGEMHLPRKNIAHKRTGFFFLSLEPRVCVGSLYIYTCLHSFFPWFLIPFLCVLVLFSPFFSLHLVSICLLTTFLLMPLPSWGWVPLQAKS